MIKKLENDRDVLQALLDGETLGETYNETFAAIWYMKDNKVKTTSNFTAIPIYHEGLNIISRTIDINGYSVPEPLRDIPVEGTIVYYTMSCSKDGFEYKEIYRDLLEKGLLHLSAENAIFHRKALESFTLNNT
jgi:hypothetical protein